MFLLEKFGELKVEKASWECGWDKSPGSKGFNLKFIKAFWDMLKVDFMRYLEEFHQNGVIPRGCNSSFISLIPKVEVPNQLDDFIQFSLVVCMYKMLAKILSNRLKKVLNKVVNQRQSSFFKDRSLLHNAMVANEVVEEARMKKEVVWSLK